METIKSSGSTPALRAGCMQQLALALDRSSAADDIGYTFAQNAEASATNSKEFAQLAASTSKQTGHPDGPQALKSHAVKTTDLHISIAGSDNKTFDRISLQQPEDGRCHGMLQTYELEEEGMTNCLPQLPMSRLLRACIARARNRCRSAWMLLQLISTLSQFLGVMVLLPQDLLLRRTSFTRSPLPVWALGYALGCLAYLPLLLFRTPSQWRHSSEKKIRTSRTTMGLSSDVQLRAAACTMSGEELRWQLAAGAGEAEEGRRLDKNKLRLRSCLDFFFAVWFVMGLIWVFGRPASCVQASPTLYSLCVTLLLISTGRYMVVIILCVALCCSLQPTTSRTSIHLLPSAGNPKQVTQANIDESLHTTLLQLQEPTTRIFSTKHKMHDKRDDKGCCICLKTFKDNSIIRVLTCSHYFHADCVDKWLMVNASCPLCKSTLQPKGIHLLLYIFKQGVLSLEGDVMF